MSGDFGESEKFLGDGGFSGGGARVGWQKKKEGRSMEEVSLDQRLRFQLPFAPKRERTLGSFFPPASLNKQDGVIP
jgi:hypothetical protein